MLLEKPRPKSNPDRRAFYPRLNDGGDGFGRLLAAVSASDQPTKQAEALDDIAQSVLNEQQAAASSGQPAPRGLTELRACALVLRDLARMGWELRGEPTYIDVAPPNADGDDDRLAAKAVIRAAEVAARDAHLAQPSVRTFIQSLENPGRGSKALPVTTLIADGAQLASRLSEIAALPRAERADALRSVIRPYLQVVTADARCEHTGIKLTDIWRYFRLTWSTPYKSQPGRNVFYLIRDAGQPYHPVMGIAALGNAMMQQSTRDDRIGWSVEGFARLIKAGVVKSSEVMEFALRSLQASYQDIYKDDLSLPPALSDTTSEMCEALMAQVSQAKEQRTEELKKGLKPRRFVQDDDGQATDAEAGEELAELANSSLFKAKRAKLAAELVRAWGVLKGFAEDDPEAMVEAIFASEQGRAALNKALQQCRNRFSGSSMMELVVCGGVAPYTHLLSGKLVCLMMLSPEVATYYQKRYEKAASIIASQLKGESVVRPSTLVYLGTTSLYAAGSSQYNRVTLPACTVIGQSADVIYEHLGRTVGYGALGLSNEATMAVREVAIEVNGHPKVNNVFGEGANPNMRMLREGFDTLGLSNVELLKHTRSRLIYGMDLATNVSRYLLGLDAEPDLIFRSPPPDASEAIAEYWRVRWLASRLNHPPALEALAAATPLQLRVSKLLPAKPKRYPTQAAQFDALEEPMTMPTAVPKKKLEDDKSEFIRRLYRDESSFSDNVSISVLKALHIKTDLERVIKSLLERGASVVLTGNAGDGKTHLLRMLSGTIKSTGAYAVSDASAESIAEVAAKWAEAINAGRPSCIAINEGPLFELIKEHRQGNPFLAEVERSLRTNVYYEPVGPEAEERKWSAPEDSTGQVFVFDLSLRQNLAPKMVRDVLNKLTEDRWFEPCPKCKDSADCPVTYNRLALSTPQVQSRIAHLLEAVSIRGERYTYRELLGLASFLIYGNQTCAERDVATSPDEGRYYHLAFEGGEGRLFDQLRAGLDPVHRTHPTVDAQLWCGQFDPEAFVLSSRPLAVSLDDRGAARRLGYKDDVDTMNAFKALKRRWFFEHPEALKHLTAATEAERVFKYLQEPKELMQSRVGKLIGLLNRFRHRSVTSESALRLWTSLTFSSRAQSRAMVSCSEVTDLALYLYRPRLAPYLETAYGNQPVDHLLLSTADEGKRRFANLRIDLELLTSLLSRRGTPAGNQELFRNIQRFNDALANVAKETGALRNILLVDGRHGREIQVRVDLHRRRYSSLGD